MRDRQEQGVRDGAGSETQGRQKGGSEKRGKEKEDKDGQTLESYLNPLELQHPYSRGEQSVKLADL